LLRIAPRDFWVQDRGKGNPRSLWDAGVGGRTIDFARGSCVGPNHPFQREHTCQGERWASLTEEDLRH